MAASFIMVVRSRFSFLHSGLFSLLQVCGWFSLSGKSMSSSSCNVSSGVEVKLPSLLFHSLKLKIFSESKDPFKFILHLT